MAIFYLKTIASRNDLVIRNARMADTRREELFVGTVINAVYIEFEKIDWD